MKKKAAKKDLVSGQPLSEEVILTEVDKITRNRSASRSLTVDLADVLVRRAYYLYVRMQANFNVVGKKIDAILKYLREWRGDSADGS